MAGSDLTKAAFIAKRMYSNDQIGEQTRRDHVLLSLVGRKTVFGGEDFRYVIRHANAQSVSGSFANAQTQAANASSQGKQLATTPTLKYGVIQIDGPSMARAQGNEQSFLDLVTMEFDGTIEEVGDSLAFDLYRANGRRGQRASINSNTVTLTVADDARNFKIGMTVIADDTVTGASPRSGSTTVASVDEDAGTVTLTDASQISLFANNDYLFRQGDPGTCMDGLEVHFPVTTPAGGDSFRGINRSLDPRRLAGVRINDTATPIEENAGLLAVKINTAGKRADIALWNPINFWAAARRLNAKVEYQAGGGTADYGFQYIMIHTPAGVVKVYSDPDCPTNVQYVGKLSEVHLRHIGALPGWIMDDGMKALRQSSADGIEGRIRAMVQSIVTTPGNWGVAAV